MKDSDWEIIYELYRTPNMRKVANILYMTQPSLTKRLQGIENEFGITVVKRTKKGVIFTEEGKLLAKKAEEYIHFMNRTKNEMLRFQQREDGHIRIGAAYTYSKEFLNDILLSYSLEESNIKINVINEPSNILFRKTLEGFYDVGFIQGDYEGDVEKVPLYTSYAYILTNKKIELSQITSMKRIEYQSNDKTKELFEDWWRNNFGKEVQGALFVTHIDFAWDLVEQGVGYTVCFIPESYKDKLKLNFIPIYDSKGNHILRTTWMVYRKTYLSDTMIDFCEYVKQYHLHNGGEN